MSSSIRPAVERAQPPKGPFVVVNRVMRWVLSSPRRAARLGQQLLLLHLTGRKSGRRLDFPVGYRRLEDGRLLVLTSSTWRLNLRGRPEVEVTLLGVRRPARAELVEDPDAVATMFRSLIEQLGHAKAGRRLGIRINVARSPTHPELVDMARRCGMSLVYLSLPEAAA